MANITKSKATLASQIDQQISAQAQAVARQALIRHTFNNAVHRHLVAKNLISDGAGSVGLIADEMEQAADEAVRTAMNKWCEKAGVKLPKGGIPADCLIELGDAQLKAFLSAAAESVVASYEKAASRK